jgi:hypothetical protein
MAFEKLCLKTREQFNFSKKLFDPEHSGEFFCVNTVEVFLAVFRQP